jgi:hypothetical protein
VDIRCAGLWSAGQYGLAHGRAMVAQRADICPICGW